MHRVVSKQTTRRAN